MIQMPPYCLLMRELGDSSIKKPHIRTGWLTRLICVRGSRRTRTRSRAIEKRAPETRQELETLNQSVNAMKQEDNTRHWITRAGITRQDKNRDNQENSIAPNLVERGEQDKT